jgi:hypothetical protein
VLAAASYTWVELPVRRLGFGGALRTAVGVVRRAAVVPKVAVVVAVLAMMGTGAAVASAPERTAAELAVAAGLQAGAEARGAPGAQKGEPDGSASPGEPTPTSRTGAPTPAPFGAKEGAHVSGFGDSVLSAALPAILARYPRAQIDAVPNKDWLDAEHMIRKAKREGRLRETVILSFGTNSGFQLDGSVDAAKRALDLIGPDRRVVLVNTVGISYWVPDANKTLDQIVVGRENVAVGDWHALVGEQPGLLHSDATHPNMDGIEAYTDLVETSFATLE